MVSPRTLQLFSGTFTLLNLTRTQNGQPILDTTGGRRPAGIINYNPDGHVSVLIHATEPEWRPANISVLDQESQYDAQWALIGKHAGAYSGPFSFNELLLINDTHGEIMHGPLEVASLPANVGTLQHRNFAFTDDGRVLNLWGSVSPGVDDTLWWERKGPAVAGLAG